MKDKDTIVVYYDGIKRDSKGRFVKGTIPPNKVFDYEIEYLRKVYNVIPPTKDYHELTLEEKQRLYELAIKINKELGYGKNVIARVLGIRPTVVHNWLYNNAKPRLNYVPVDTSPSPVLSYFIGVMLGDGNFTKHQRHYDIRLATKDKEFAEEFKKCLETLLKGGKVRVYLKRPRKEHHSPIWWVETCSKGLYDFLSTLTLKKVEELASYYPSELLRGFFDSEGGVYIIDRKRRYGMVYASNTNRELLEVIRKIALDHFGIPFKLNEEKRKKRRKQKKQCYRIAICRKRHIVQFYKHIGFTIKRKMSRLRLLVEGKDFRE